jgi:hypothetical protein
VGLEGLGGGGDDVFSDVQDMTGVELDGQREVFLIIPGILTKSICSGKEKRPTIGEPVNMRILIFSRSKWVAMAMVRRMWPRP